MIQRLGLAGSIKSNMADGSADGLVTGGFAKQNRKIYEIVAKTERQTSSEQYC